MAETDAPVVGERLGELLAAGARTLSGHSATPRLDAEILLADTLGVPRARLVIDRDAVPDAAARVRFARLLRRRRTGEPVAYLVGRRAFRRLELSVDRRVLIPRPETEHLVEAAIDELPRGASVLDVGTGSGAIALALADERPDLRIRAVDVSEDALALARVNAQRLSLEVSFSQGDLLDGAEPVDAVLANLPYVEDGAALPVDVSGFEPALALYGGGADGLGVIRRLCAQLAARPWPRRVLLEIGETQASGTRSLLRAAGFQAPAAIRDLSGRDRVILASRAAGAAHERS